MSSSHKDNKSPNLYQMLDCLDNLLVSGSGHILTGTGYVHPMKMTCRIEDL